MEDPSKLSEQQRQVLLEAYEASKSTLNFQRDISHLGFPSPTDNIYKGTIIFSSNCNTDIQSNYFKSLFIKP